MRKETWKVIRRLRKAVDSLYHDYASAVRDNGKYDHDKHYYLKSRYEQALARYNAARLQREDRK